LATRDDDSGARRLGATEGILETPKTRLYRQKLQFRK
jgi:hypothetical protein